MAIHCWDCNSKYDSRCLDHFNNYSTALVDCDQMPDKVQHIDINDDLGEVSRATLCRKTVQTGESIRDAVETTLHSRNLSLFYLPTRQWRVRFGSFEAVDGSRTSGNWKTGPASTGPGQTK